MPPDFGLPPPDCTCEAAKSFVWTAIAPPLSSLDSSAPITSLIELRICPAWLSNVGEPSPGENPLAIEDAAIGACCGGAGWFPPETAGSARAAPAVAVPEEAPVEAAPAELPRAAATPAAAPSNQAAPAVNAVTAVPTIATAVLPTSPLTIRFATNGMTAMASE